MVLMQVEAVGKRDSSAVGSEGKRIIVVTRVLLSVMTTFLACTASALSHFAYGA